MKQIISNKYPNPTLLLFLVFLFMVGCRTVKISKYEIPDTDPINLPRLMAEVDIPNMQYEFLKHDSVLMGNVLVTKVFHITDTTNSFLPLVEIIPARVVDIIGYYDFDVTNNINSSDTIPYGFIKLEILGFNEKNNKPLMFLSAWTLCISCVLGAPMTNTLTTLELRATIYDAENNEIKKYESIGTGKSYMAFYWGYGKDLKKKSNLLAYNDAMKIIKNQIRGDKDFIMSKLE